ncbi:hypothetical protein RhiJN_10161 [Ceratobasidium sp. AG-Ba]|nr:hypothetical protein RhiJN_10161 [Ceratobasidium sp. AG-Ba]QRW10915.1 hypothetical protein RhiLY_09914 [Ceratobasidium sp. AG-Ba]
MAIISFISVALLGLSLGAVTGTPTPDTRSTAACVKRYGGHFTSSGYIPLDGDDYVFPPYYFNSKGEIAYDKANPSGHPPIYADFQASEIRASTCTPNYAQEPNPGPKTDGIVYGRFYVPSLNKCLAVTNSNGKPPYFLGTAPCPSAKDMATEKSIPFNFVSDETGGEVDMRWVGGTVPRKGIYQGGSSASQYCHGQYYVNATNPADGYNVPYLGEPNTDASDNYRVHLYCPFTNTSQSKGTGRNSFLVPPA